MNLWLHSQGYTYFSIPKLTYPEIMGLLNSFNRKVKKEEQMAKAAQRKSKRGRR